MSLSTMEALKADNLLLGSDLLTQITNLKSRLQYKTDTTNISFEDYYVALQDEISSIPKIKLNDVLPPGGGLSYTRELISALEEIQDTIEIKTIKVIKFQGDLTRAMADVEDLSASFCAWYHLQASEYLAEHKSLKLPGALIKDLASGEFNRLMDHSNSSLGSLIEAVKIELRRLDSKKKMAKTTFDLGREQVNAAWTNQLTEDLGISDGPSEFGLMHHPEAEEPEEIEQVHEETAIDRLKKLALEEASLEEASIDRNKKLCASNEDIAKAIIVKHGAPVLATVIKVDDDPKPVTVAEVIPEPEPLDSRVSEIHSLNGFNADGSVAGDYLAAGRDPNLPRLAAEEIAGRVKTVVATAAPKQEPTAVVPVVVEPGPCKPEVKVQQPPPPPERKKLVFEEEETVVPIAVAPTPPATATPAVPPPPAAAVAVAPKAPIAAAATATTKTPRKTFTFDLDDNEL